MRVKIIKRGDIIVPFTHGSFIAGNIDRRSADGVGFHMPGIVMIDALYSLNIDSQLLSNGGKTMVKMQKPHNLPLEN